MRISSLKVKFHSSPQHVAASSGSGNADLEKLCAILEAVPALKYICLDVANGYSEYFVEFVKTVREKFPKHTIMVRDTIHHLGWHLWLIECVYLKACAKSNALCLAGW